MNYLNNLTSARQRDETSKEAGDNSMVVKPSCGNPEIPKSRRQEEEHRVKAKLPEPQTDTRGSHSLSTPDKGQSPRETHTVRLCERKQSGDGAGNKPDNGRTGHLHAHNHHYIRTTGSSKQEFAPAWRRSLHNTQRAGVTPGAAGLRIGRDGPATGPTAPPRPTDRRMTARCGRGHC